MRFKKIYYESEKNEKKKYIIMAIVSVFLLCFLINAVLIIKDFFGFEKSNETIVSVPEGAGAVKICEILEKDGIIKE